MRPVPPAFNRLAPNSRKWRSCTDDPHRSTELIHRLWSDKSSYQGIPMPHLHTAISCFSRCELTFQKEDQEHGFPSETVWIQRFPHQDGTWPYDLWRLQTRRLLLTGMETARVLSMENPCGRSADWSHSIPRKSCFRYRSNPMLAFPTWDRDLWSCHLFIQTSCCDKTFQLYSNSLLLPFYSSLPFLWSWIAFHLEIADVWSSDENFEMTTSPTLLDSKSCTGGSFIVSPTHVLLLFFLSWPYPL